MNIYKRKDNSGELVCQLYIKLDENSYQCIGDGYRYDIPNDDLFIHDNLKEKDVVTLNEYERQMMRTSNINNVHISEKLLNAALGLCGESGEVADIIKKHIFQNHELDKEKIINELGDIHWYWSYLCKSLEVNPNEVLQKNIDKLRKRYPNGFSSEDSIKRVDMENKQ